MLNVKTNSSALNKHRKGTVLTHRMSTKVSRSHGNSDVTEKARGLLLNLSRELSLKGCDLSDVIRVKVYLSDESDFFEFDRAYSEFFHNGNKLQPDRYVVFGASFQPFDNESLLGIELVTKFDADAFAFS